MLVRFCSYIVNYPCKQEIRNTVGNIPMEWYRDYSHIGYDIRGSKIAKPAQGDEVSVLLYIYKYIYIYI